MGNFLVSGCIKSVILESDYFSENFEKVVAQLESYAPPEDPVLSLVLPVSERNGTALFGTTGGIILSINR